MTTLRTLPSIIAQSSPITLNCRDYTEPTGRTGYERYWRIATFLHARDKCSTVWVLGIKHNANLEWLAATSLGIIKALHRAIKMKGTDDATLSFVVIEPLGTLYHRIKPSNLAPILERIEVHIAFIDPNQQTIGF